jgi:quercetin dioxygenase-like cupin family protein
MTNIDSSQAFYLDKNITWETLGNGIKRKVLGYDKSVMMVNVSFEAGAIGTIHSHYHTQVSYVIKGKFEVQIGDSIQILTKGDCFFVKPNILHGAICLEEGELLDVFTPFREDFIV